MGVSCGRPVEAPPTGQGSVLPESQRPDIPGHLAGLVPSVAARGILSRVFPPRPPAAQLWRFAAVLGLPPCARLQISPFYKDTSCLGPGPPQ